MSIILLTDNSKCLSVIFKTQIHSQKNKVDIFKDNQKDFICFLQSIKFFKTLNNIQAKLCLLNYISKVVWQFEWDMIQFKIYWIFVQVSRGFRKKKDMTKESPFPEKFYTLILRSINANMTTENGRFRKISF